MASYNPKVVSSRDFDDDDFDFEYFSRTYKPLSNLPTPPPSNRNSVTSSPVLGEEDANADSSLLGPAVHLVNLHPPGASVKAPSVSLVQTILSRAALPLETIALAVCILDSLDAKFSRKFRMSLPLATNPLPSKRHTITSAASSLITHIDSVAPELIILTALVIAFKFTDDCQEPTQYFASAWGKGLWTCDQINATERCIMEHLGYRILPLCERGIIDDAVEDMRRAGVMALSEKKEEEKVARVVVMTPQWPVDSVGGHARSISVPVRPGEAVMGLGLSLTPVDTPTEERQTELGASM
ncbi:hypothetical protein N0V82_009057 [Gnomoniopsis sp. IMI 355080]|nr:hypothetical protein N0V82_009057 [Gnomoniopsis sp. IMI 355080]